MRKGNLFFVLRRLLRPKSGKPIRIFLLRGGLGNQIFQVVGIANLARIHKFDVILSDYDVRRNPRDKNGALCFKLNMAAIFGVDTSAIKADWGIDLFVRIVSNKFIARKFGPRINLDCGIGDLDKSLAIAHGYLQTKCHVKNFSEKSIAELFQIPENLYSDSPAIALHIRATDGLEREDMRLGHEYYERALNYFTNGETTLVDVYTDDISYAKKFCAQIGKHNFNFPEELKSLEPIELLRALGGYNRIVSSKSTLCWWACFIAKLGKSKVEVVSPWEAAMELENWFPLK